jgi:hydrogenase maturation protease
LKRPLIIGLGNPLMGDDGAGSRVVELLSADPAVQARADLEWAGTDLFRAAGWMEGREWVILVDAAESTGRAGQGVGEISLVEGGLQETHAQQAHALSAAQALELLCKVTPSLAGTRFTWVLIHVAAAQTTAGLSAEVSAATTLAAYLIRGKLDQWETRPNL